MATFEENKLKLKEILLDDTFSSSFKMNITDFEEDFIRAEIPFADGLKNSYRSVHGGALYAVADILASALACSGGKYCTTLEGSMNYLEPAVADEYFVCECRRVRAGGHIIVVDIKINSDTGKLVDSGTFTFYRSNKDLIETEE